MSASKWPRSRGTVRVLLSGARPHLVSARVRARDGVKVRNSVRVRARVRV